MILIWGFKARAKTISTGEFFCSRCGADRSYALQQIRRWFTLFFIPLFPAGKALGEQVKCSTCGARFQPEVLNTPTSASFSFSPASIGLSVIDRNLSGLSFQANPPIVPVSLTLSPWTTIGAGVTTTATVTLNQPAPSGGALVTLSASDPKAAKVTPVKIDFDGIDQRIVSIPAVPARAYVRLLAGAPGSG